MGTSGWSRWLRGAAAGLLALGLGCDAGYPAEAVCGRLCECFTFFPSEQRECVAECAGEIDLVAEECVACLDRHDCLEIERGACDLDCAELQNLIPGGTDEANW